MPANSKVVADELGGVKTGVNVFIKRSDGRVHASKVSAIDLDSRVVTVEFIENGQTKAKIEGLDQIFSLNEHLAPRQCLAPAPEPKTRPLSAKNRNSILVTNSRKPLSPTDSDQREVENIPHVETMPPPSSRSGIGRTSRSIAGDQLPSRQPSHETKSSFNDTKSSGANRRKSMIQEKPKEMMMPPPKQAKNIAPPRNDAVSRVRANSESRRRSDVPPSKNDSVSRGLEGADTRRRSGAVKEVDKIKENREKRRAQQAKVLEEKIDYGHPNWQFLQMICEYNSPPIPYFHFIG